ncbi:cation:proton antiporter [Kitasatospora sp. P5_F3]
MTSSQVLVGIGLIVALAVGSQLLASLLRIPAILLLLPAGFVAGALTDDVNPEKLLGPAFPLLGFVRPAERLQRILVWEGSLIDPIGGILGAIVFHGVLAGEQEGVRSQLAQFSASAAVGLAGGAVGAAVLWLLLRHLSLGETLGTTVQLAAVVSVAAACDAFRDDTGLIAAVVMGMALANLPGLDMPARRPFFETLVSLIIGVLFISISATVTPQSLRHVALPALGLVAALVLVVRPLVALLSTARTDVPYPQRWFIGWMAPRGIVAAATASTFSVSLVQAGIGGAQKILPATFVVIVATVMVYGLTALPVARWLDVRRSARSRPLLVGGDPWVVELGQALRSAGLDVLMWAGLDRQRQSITDGGLDLAPGELLAAATGAGAELEGITDVLLLTDEDDFNALALMTLKETAEGPVHRLAPPTRSHGVVAPFTGSEALFGQGLSRPELARRYAGGARIVSYRVDGGIPAGHDLLFLVRPDGQLSAVTGATTPTPNGGDIAILLTPPPKSPL